MVDAIVISANERRWIDFGLHLEVCPPPAAAHPAFREWRWAGFALPTLQGYREDDMYKTIGTLGRRLRLGVIGGGRVRSSARCTARRRASTTITRSSLRCSPPTRSGRGRRGGPSASRRPGLWLADEMFAQEKAREDGIEVVAIMTPNDSHCRLACGDRGGLDVICDKPLATSLDDALDLVKRVEARASSSARPSTTPAFRWSGRRWRWCATAISARSGW